MTDAKSQISRLVDTIVDIMGSDLTTTIRQDYVEIINQTTNKLNAKIEDVKKEQKTSADSTNAKITELQKHQKSLSDSTNAKIDSLQKTQQAISNNLNAKINEIQKSQQAMTNALNSKIDNLQRSQKSIADATNGKINDLQRKYDQLKVARWPAGHYCILANGACPAGFQQITGYLRAIKQVLLIRSCRITFFGNPIPHPPEKVVRHLIRFSHVCGRASLSSAPGGNITNLQIIVHFSILLQAFI